MLISPPFLPARAANQTDAAWLDTAMSGVVPGHIPRQGDNTIAGSYPVSLELGWHGGIHLLAPNDAQGHALIVRAIADGTVVYMRTPRDQNDDHTDALNYGAPAGRRCWTSDGVVVIRHTTDIGANAQGQAVSVTFYSLYMHLHSIRPTVAAGRRIYRKAEIGEPGYIYGQPNRIHFEIFCDDANLALLVGRGSGDLRMDRDGRSDVVFGEIYFHLPAGAAVFAEEPLSNNPSAHRQPPPEHLGGARPQIQPLQAVHNTPEDLVVGIRYAGGEARVDANGRVIAGSPSEITVTTYPLDGGSTSSQALIDLTTEHNLYAKAKSIAESYPSTGQPPASAVYELLRFGRIINTEQETLNPADVPHWRRISYGSASGQSVQGWVNLNANNVHKFSDADFPHWRQWRLIDDSADGDSRCDSKVIRDWFDVNQDGQIEATEMSEGMSAAGIRAKLEHTICRFPSEWNSTTVDARWSWLKTSTDENPQALSEEDFAKFQAHAEALCFWSSIADLPEAPWRFHPRLFIQIFRKCGWLSESDLSRVLDSAPVAGRARAEDLRSCMNKVLRKYLINMAPLRSAHFLAQVGHETGWWLHRTELGGDRYFRTMYEVITPTESGEDFDDCVSRRKKLPNGKWPDPIAPTSATASQKTSRADYVSTRPGEVQTKANGLGNTQAGDGPRFRGRGFLQITGRNNYSAYGVYRGADFTTDPNNELLASDDYNACDASGYYWAKAKINSEASSGSGNTAIDRVGGLVNRGSASKTPAHQAERRTAFRNIWARVNDEP